MNAPDSTLAAWVSLRTPAPLTARTSRAPRSAAGSEGSHFSRLVSAVGSATDRVPLDGRERARTQGSTQVPDGCSTRSVRMHGRRSRHS